jgi:hypothetical protein
MVRPSAFLSAVLLACLTWCCAPMERDNPLDPRRASGVEATASLSLELPLPKLLVRVVHRIVATLEGPGMQTVSKELSHPPLGPATGTIGAVPPGSNRILTIAGYDLGGNLLFSGQQTGLVITAGDTTRISVDLNLVPLPVTPGLGDSASAAPG